MRYIKIDTITTARRRQERKTLSTLVLGGSKFVDMPIRDGVKIIEKAMDLGINFCDAHHRYGNAEQIFGKFKRLIKMTKLSVYNLDNAAELFIKSVYNLGRVYILWISDLDNEELYNKGINFYKSIQTFTNLGITTESPELAVRALFDMPQCRFFMVPAFLGGQDFSYFIDEAKKREKYIFCMKPFDDGRALKKYSILDCLKYVYAQDIDFIIIGTKNITHLEEIVKTWEQFTEKDLW